MNKPNVNDFDGVWPSGVDGEYKWNTEHQENALKFFIALCAYYRSRVAIAERALTEIAESEPGT